MKAAPPPSPPPPPPSPSPPALAAAVAADAAGTDGVPPKVKAAPPPSPPPLELNPCAPLDDELKLNDLSSPFNLGTDEVTGGVVAAVAGDRVWVCVPSLLLNAIPKEMS